MEKFLLNNKIEEFREAEAERKVFDILPKLYIRSSTDMAILDSWVKYFKLIDVPFKVRADTETTVSLWKIWYTKP